MEGYQIAGLGVGITVPIMLWVVLIGLMTDKTWRRKIRWHLWHLLPLSLTAWLWMPWLFFGLYTLGRMNLNHMNDLGKEEQVLPAQQHTRPSAADEKEH